MTRIILGVEPITRVLWQLPRSNHWLASLWMSCGFPARTLDEQFWFEVEA